MSMIAPRRDSVGPAVAAAVAALAVLVAIAVVALRTGAGQLADERAMRSVVAGREAEVAVLGLLGWVSIGSVLTVSAVCVAVAIARGRMHLAAAALTVIVGSNVTTQLLKHVILERSALEVIAPNSLPSGHTTVVASAVGALLLVAPRALRVPVVAAGAFAVTFTGASTVVAGWHRPADIVAALAVCVAWTAVGSVIAGGAHSPVSGIGAGAMAGAGVALVLLVGIGVRPSYGWSGFLEAALVLSAVGLVTALAIAAMERIAPTVQP